MSERLEQAVAAAGQDFANELWLFKAENERFRERFSVDGSTKGPGN